MMNESKVFFESIDFLASKISNYINIGRVQNKLIQNKKNWNQICSSIDVLEDTTYAISSYINDDSFPNNDGLKYIYIYGVLQALFLQQDSLRHLTCALLSINEKDYKVNDELEKIRNIRNEAIGHPTNKGGGKSFHYISRITIDKNGFDLLSSFSDKDDIYKEVKTIDVINIQLKIIVEDLKILLKKLEEIEMEHKSKFKEVKLVNFLKGSDYSIEKIFEALYTKDEGKKSFYISLIKPLKERYLTIEKELKDREILPNDFWNDELEKVEYIFDSLGDYFTDNQRNFTNNDIFIFLSYLRDKNKELLEELKNIDEEIDEMVYKLYDLSEDEIRIVEGIK
ncbi:MAG: hypothetical protein QG567_2522 [Campylobacterota bacterium]|nr:hypothetical protein [Campylobacterota bacterium]